jgi:hypothetical protein
MADYLRDLLVSANHCGARIMPMVRLSQFVAHQHPRSRNTLVSALLLKMLIPGRH